MLSEVSALSEQFDKLDAALGSSKALHKDARLRKGSMPGALSSGNLDASLLGHPHETSPTDLATMVAAALLIVVAALIASYVPARRATLVDPVEALRRD